ncbi:MAG TPA: MOSC domain-containing protein [Candidatus Binatia bacterium]|nr:MOSC domain-containing protein [Candidatus Binatia bacterium]
MKLVSVNVGLPREITWHGRRVTTGIFKAPRAGRTMLRTLNLDGDGQADLSVHGGTHKAAYAYPMEHYAYWRRELPNTPLPWGAFGENFTTEGLTEDTVHIGDRFRLGAAEVIVTQPRMPCYKLAIKFARAEFVKAFLASERTGFYFAVLREGEVEAEDSIERIAEDERRLSVRDIVRLYTSDAPDPQLLQRAVQLDALPDGWREHFVDQLAKAQVS